METLILDGVIRRDAFELTIRLTAAPGEVVGLVGGVGSGKSTVLAVLAGILPLAEGRLSGPGGVWADPATGSWWGPDLRPVAHLPSRPALIDDVAAVDQVVNASASARRGNGAAAVLRRDAERLLDELGIVPGVAVREGWTLSGGETQRVAIARCFAAAAPVVLLDDPLAALDSRNRPLVRTWLADRLARRSSTVVLACSDPADTAVLADRVVELP